MPTLSPTSSPGSGDNSQFTLSGWNLVMAVVIPFLVVMGCLFVLIVTRKRNIQKHTKVAVIAIEATDGARGAPREERKEQEDERSVKPKSNRVSSEPTTKKIAVAAKESDGFSEVCLLFLFLTSLISLSVSHLSDSTGQRRTCPTNCVAAYQCVHSHDTPTIFSRRTLDGGSCPTSRRSPSTGESMESKPTGPSLPAISRPGRRRQVPFAFSQGGRVRFLSSRLVSSSTIKQSCCRLCW
jgi:hypothetical protein